MNTHEHKLQAILDKAVDGKRIFGTSFALKSNAFSWEGAAGNFTTAQPYFIASTTKLFTTALILRFAEEGRLSLNDTLAAYFDKELLQGLHIYKGKEYSAALTINQLLAHTTGLPDYFQNKGPGGKSLEDEIVSGNDQAWTFEQAIARTKAMKPLFAPGSGNLAHYSDANFQLLGKIIACVSGKTFADTCSDKIIQPLGLKNTYLYADANDRRPKTLYYKNSPLGAYKAMTSFGPDGGMVSTSADMLVFIEAFFSGKLFSAAYLTDIQQWKRIFFPMQSGIGIHKFQLPWIFNPFGTVPYFIGHSGLSGALAFYSPEKNLFIAGTVNQVAHPDLSFKTLIKLTQVALKN